MTILITGVCGFVGSSLARALREMSSANHILGIDNLSRRGSEINRSALRKLGMRLIHGDVRCTSDFENLPDAEWVIDAAADPSVLAGGGGGAARRRGERGV